MRGGNIIFSVLEGRTPIALWNAADNRSGGHKAEVARAVVNAAVADGFAGIAAGSCGNYAHALTIAAQEQGLRTAVFLPASTDTATRRRVQAAGGDVVMVDGVYEDAVARSRSWAVRHGTADANVDGPYEDAVLNAIAMEATAALEQVNVDRPTSLWIPTGNGTTLAGCFRALSMLQDGARYRLRAVVSRHNNPLGISGGCVPADYWQTESVINAPLTARAPLHDELATGAIRDTGGSVRPVSDAELLEARDIMRDLGIRASPAGAAGLAGLLASSPLEREGHVILVTGMTGEL